MLLSTKRRRESVSRLPFSRNRFALIKSRNTRRETKVSIQAFQTMGCGASSTNVSLHTVFIGNGLPLEMVSFGSLLTCLNWIPLNLRIFIAGCSISWESKNATGRFNRCTFHQLWRRKRFSTSDWWNRWATSRYRPKTSGICFRWGIPIGIWIIMFWGKFYH